MENNQIPISELPFSFNGLEAEYGTIHYAERICPGVYYISAATSMIRPYIGSEYYVVTEDSPAISPSARAYGTPLPANPKLLLYHMDDCFDKGRHVVGYEVHKYLVEHGCPLPENESLLADQVWGREVCPEYFGEFPIPEETPWGIPVRHEKVWNGLYWLETESMGWVLAIAYPYCEDLYDQTKALAALTRYDLENGIENTYGYRFYPYALSPLPLFELWAYAQETWGGQINYAALKNVILETFPDYAKERYKGSALTEDVMIQPSPGAGIEFYHFSPDQ